MEELSLILKNPQEGEFLDAIQWNKDQIIEAVSSITAKYENIVYTDDQITEAKEDRAKLNKMRTALSDKRIQIKKEIMKPYDIFEAEVKEVTALIDAPIAQIDAQIKEYEDEEKKKKNEKILAHFNENVGDLKDTVPFEKLFDKKWLNKSVSIKKATGEIDEMLEKIRNDLELIRHNCKGDMVVAVLNAYMKEFKMSDASNEMIRLQHIADMEEQRLRDEAMRKEREKRVQNAAGEEEIPVPPKEEVAEEPPAQPDYQKAKVKPKILRAPFVAYGTKEQLLALKQYMEENGIEVRKE